MDALAGRKGAEAGQDFLRLDKVHKGVAVAAPMASRAAPSSMMHKLRGTSASGAPDLALGRGFTVGRWSSRAAHVVQRLGS